MEEAEEGSYNNSHRALLQAFMAHSILTVEEIKPIFAAILTAHESRPILPADITPEDITNHLQTISSRLQPYDLELRKTRSQHDRTSFYALINTTSDPTTQLATTHTADEIAYIKRLLDAMFETNNTRNREVMAVDGVQAIRLARVPRNSNVNGNGGVNGTQVNGDGEGEEVVEQSRSPQGASLTIPQTESLLKALVQESWLERSRAGFYSLAPRALMELRSYLKETYNEPPVEGEDPDAEPPVIRIRDCEACREIVTMGQRCADLDCGCRLHEHCTRQVFRGREEGRRCPRCKREWTGVKVGERAAVGYQARRGSERVNGFDGAGSEEEED